MSKQPDHIEVRLEQHPLVTGPDITEQDYQKLMEFIRRHGQAESGYLVAVKIIYKEKQL